MSQQELLKKVVLALEGAGIEYMLTGSIASSLQGEPRSTHDIDLVVAVGHESTGALLAAFQPPDFFLDEVSIHEAIAHATMFNLIDVNSGDKVDFWMLTGEPFDRSRFSRKYSEDVMGMHIMVSSPEDTILAKLRWASLSGGSEKQFTDALRIYEVQFERLDVDYLQQWAKELEVEPLLRRVQEEAETT
jgi:hypothetical protein